MSYSSGIPLASGKNRESRPSVRVSKSNIPRASSFTRKSAVDLHPLRRSKSSLSYHHLSKTSLTPKYSIGSSRNATPKTPTSVKKDVRPINDKKWQKLQFSKIRHYLLNHPKCTDATLADKLKPPTIASFVAAMRILLKDIDDRIEITTANYKEEIIAHLTSIKYPQKITMSFMKTVNTNFMWPQVVALMSYLVDTIEYIRNLDSIYGAKMDHDKITLHKLVVGYVFHHFSLWDQEKDETEAGITLRENYSKFCGLKGAEEFFSEHEQLVTKDKEMESRVQNQNRKIEEMKNKIAILKKQKNEYAVDIETFDKNYIENKNKLMEKLNNLGASKSNVEKNIKDFKTIIKNQKHSVKEKEELINEIKDLEHTISVQKDKLEFCEELNYKTDFEFTDTKHKYERKIAELNKQIMTMSLIIPKFKELFLRESGFFHYDYKQHLEGIIKRNSDIFNELEKELQNIDEELINKRKYKCELETELVELQTKYQKLKLKEEKEMEKLEKLKTESNFEMEQLKRELKQCEKIKKEKKQSIPAIQDLKNQIKELEETKNTIKKQKADREIEIIEFFEKIAIKMKSTREKILIYLEEVKEALARNNINLAEQYEELHTLMENIQQFEFKL